MNQSNRAAPFSRSRPHLRELSDSKSATAARTLILAVVLILSAARAVRAQHASDDPIASATDGFGLTLGLESIGLYSPGFIRGFNPQTAGNARIDGLYFDQQGSLSNRVVEGSTIRIGISEIGYSFPAPTGIVDYDLRHVADGTPTATVVASAGPFEARGVSVDGSLPVVGTELQFPWGLSYQLSTQTQVSSPNPGYTSIVADLGTPPQWKPNDQLTVRGILDWTRTTDAKTLPVILTAGDYLPPSEPRGYFGQNWAEGRSIAENYGGIVSARLSSDWTLMSGLFRSIADNPVSYSDLYLDTRPNGSAEQFMVANPDQMNASTSGEARLRGQLQHGSFRQDVVLMIRGRDTVARYGGSDVVDLGPAFIDQSIQVPEPSFSYSTRTKDRTDLWSVGAAYRAEWQGRADFSFGVQRESYDKDVVSPGLTPATLSDHPLRFYSTAAVVMSDAATLYAGYTQGLEDSGIAPSSADNRGAILPDARTWQMDGGVRYFLTPALKVIAGVFEIEKPYFNLNADNVDRQLGLQRASGIELSASGELYKNLNVTAALLLGEVKTLGPSLRAEGVGPFALNQARFTASINASYKLRALPAISTDISIFHFGSYPASIDDIAQGPPGTLIALGARYHFSLFHAPTTLRVQVQNLTNSYFWNLSYGSPQFSQYQPRALFAYLTADF